MSTNTHSRNRVFVCTIATILAVGISLVVVGESTTQTDAAKEQLCQDVATLFRSARSVISKNQSLINDETKGDKGLDADLVVAKAKENFAKATGNPYPELASDTLEGQAHAAMIVSIRQVMDQAQPLINERGKGFKGFLPAVFAKQVADHFTTNMSGRMSIKLTAPKSYVRNRANRPDRWEHKVIESYFKKQDWKKGKSFAEDSQVKSKDAYRFILPEYYSQSCLKCHGQPAGELDITGGKKEGGTLGELGGAISVVIYDDAYIASVEND